MRRIIALSGAKTCGKTTAFNMIKEYHPGVVEITFAGKLKDVCGDVFDIDPKYFHEQDLKEVPFDIPIELTPELILEVIRAYDTNISLDQLTEHSGKLIETPRKLLQYIGTQLLNRIDPNIHMDQAFVNLPESGIVVVTDMRFMSEFDRLLSMDCEMYHIDNDKAEESSKGDTHQSEMDRHLFKEKCIRLDNNGTLDEFRDIITQEVL